MEQSYEIVWLEADGIKFKDYCRKTINLSLTVLRGFGMSWWKSEKMSACFFVLCSCVRACPCVCVHASVRVRWNRRCVWLIVFCYLCLPECYLNGSTCPTITNEWEGKKNTVCECVRGRVSVCKQEWEVFVWVYGWIRVRGWGVQTCLNICWFVLVDIWWLVISSLTLQKQHWKQLDKWRAHRKIIWAKCGISMTNCKL